ncbi:MAG: efflux RND transporter periplasmic adaptor subunit [Akkermansia sp.]|nr:efflux RND transporter periplasmic adaptor subunit [Akkermansia sp.]
MKPILKWGVIVAICAGGAAAWYLNADSAEKTVQLRTTSVTKGDFVNKVQATGTLEPQELVDVGAQVTGEIKEFGTDLNGNRIDYGSEVKAGQLLARIDDTIVELDIKRAEASVAQAKAQILSADAAVVQAKANISQAKANKNKADRDLQRAKKLGVGDALSQMDYDQYVTAAESAAANLESALAQLNTAEAQQAGAAAQLQSAEAQLQSELRNRDYTRITTPVDGTIVVRQVNVGQTVVSSMNATTLFLVARDLSKMQIWASVNEADIAKVRPGQEVRYTVDALPNETFKGTVNKIRPNATMSSNVVTYIVEVDIDNPDRKLLPYMSADANFIVKEIKDALLIPDAAFDFRPTPDMIAESHRGKRPAPPAKEDELPAGLNPADAESGGERALVWKKDADNKVIPVRVIKGLSDGTRTVVTPAVGESLQEGDELVTGIMLVTEKSASGSADGNSPFGMKRPERRQRSTGGAEAKPGQNAQAGGRPGPPM